MSWLGFLVLWVALLWLGGVLSEVVFPWMWNQWRGK